MQYVLLFLISLFNFLTRIMPEELTKHFLFTETEYYIVMCMRAQISKSSDMSGISVYSAIISYCVRLFHNPCK